ncbi:MAG: 3-hydroxyacyl-CoA dehydrogenase NAD-binding domain-containing protein [Balneolales bacterium]|nr:3-hydroxyacyl-CoA dehydrogenase NAD-binding domain-containing protein [Balneolales bacterium]
MSYLQLEIKEQVAIISLDKPGEKVNTLDESMMSQFSEILDSIESNPEVIGVILISRKKDNFIAGADIEMFTARETAEEMEQLSIDGHSILNRIEAYPKPVVVAIHGSCMGGGLELSMACSYRIASSHPKTILALPEVKLGVIPGTGGTQRMPRLIGIQKALSYMLTGGNIYAHKAKKIGLIDELTHKDALEEAAVKAVHKLTGSKPFHRKDKRSLVERLLEGNRIGRSIIFKQAGKKTLAQTKGNYPAPIYIIESVRYGYKHGLKKGLLNEARLFGEAGATSESRALVNLFFGMTGAKKNPLENEAKPVKTIGVLGAGLMGAGVADVSINKGRYKVLLKDRTQEDAAKGEKVIWEGLNKKAKKRIITIFERDQVFSRVTGTDSYDAFNKCDVVIEAVFEDLELKRRIVAEVEANTKEHCIFATNTSSLPVKDIAEGAKRPENIIGMHYFSPVQKMPLLEIITTPRTADWVTATAYDIGVKQGKTVIVVNDGPGFYTTRILAPYMNEALLLLEEGASVEFLEKVMKKFGYPVGPMALLDEVGMDVASHVGDTMSPLFNARGGKPSSKAKELMKAGYLGRKNGQGVYDYSGKKKKVNSGIYQFFGGNKRTDPDVEVAQQRMGLMMVNEAAYCLQEEILKSPTDGDLGAILGLGFPPFTGGPFRYLDHVGIGNVADRLKKYADEFGPRFKPAPVLESYSKARKRFYS